MVIPTDKIINILKAVSVLVLMTLMDVFIAMSTGLIAGALILPINRTAASWMSVVVGVIVYLYVSNKHKFMMYCKQCAEAVDPQPRGRLD